MSDETNICPKETPCAEELKLPGMLDMAKNLMKDGAKIASNAITGKSVLVEDSVREHRISVCRNCPMFTPEERCSVCGCFMKVKVAFKTSECPINNW